MPSRPLITVLGIETSCDETAIALVNSERQILLNTIYSQQQHNISGGVIPEIAARQHLITLPQLINSHQASLNNIDAIAVTAGPGLIGPVLIGASFAKGLALARNLPCIPVNHLEGHALTARLTESKLEFPYLLLLVSGGHCQILLVHGVRNYEILGSTLDDALGEAFDKVARLLELGYPGGPAVEKLALCGNPHKYTLPLPLYGQNNCDFSFSGLKTAVINLTHKLRQTGALTELHKADICAAFQLAVCKIIRDRLSQALKMLRLPANQRQSWENALVTVDDEAISPYISSLVIAGGVAANQYIRAEIHSFAIDNQLELIVAPPKLCTDNAAMIAWAGLEWILAGGDLSTALALDFNPVSRWSLTELSMK